MIRVEAVDERDSSWEDDRPRFRVYLHGSGQTATAGWTATYDVTGADVIQVIEWAQRRAGTSRTYAVALVRDDEAEELRNPGRGRGLVWLVGTDGNGAGWDEAELEAQRRMLGRRNRPVVVPAADRMPPEVPSLDPADFEELDHIQPPR